MTDQEVDGIEYKDENGGSQAAPRQIKRIRSIMGLVVAFKGLIGP
jgi:hypothetical protein